MKLLKTEKQWLKWLGDEVAMYKSQIKAREGYAGNPPKFPCYGYAVAQSFNYEEQRPIYLCAAEVNLMHKKLTDACFPKPATQPQGEL